MLFYNYRPRCSQFYEKCLRDEHFAELLTDAANLMSTKLPVFSESGERVDSSAQGDGKGADGRGKEKHNSFKRLLLLQLQQDFA